MDSKTIQKTADDALVTQMKKEAWTGTLHMLMPNGEKELLCSVASTRMYGFCALWGAEKQIKMKKANSSLLDAVGVKVLSLHSNDGLFKTAYGRLSRNQVDKELVSIAPLVPASNLASDGELSKVTNITLELNEGRDLGVEFFELKSKKLPQLLALLNADSEAFASRVIALLQLSILDTGKYDTLFGEMEVNELGETLLNLLIAKTLKT